MNLKVKTEFEIESIISVLNVIYDETEVIQNIITQIDKWCFSNTDLNITKINKAIYIVIFYPFII